MDRIPLQALLEPCAVDGGVGRNLEYDSRHMATCQAAEGTSEQQYGDTIIAAEPPDYRKILSTALELSIETRDLRLGVLIAESLCRLQGLYGLVDGLELVAGWAIDLWDDIYPQLDASDGNDPVERVGVLSRLTHSDYLLSGIRDLPLVTEPALGTITHRDLKLATQGLAQRGDALTQPEIEAIYLSVAVDDLRHAGDQLYCCLESVERLTQFLDDKLGTGQWDATALVTALSECSNSIETAYGSRVGAVYVPARQRGKPTTDGSIAAAADPSLSPGISQADENVHNSTERRSDAPSTVASIQADGQLLPFNSDKQPFSIELLSIETRIDAMLVLDRLCDYYQKHEPASPVPLLLQRAKRLIPMSFVDILRELAPDGLPQAMQSVGALKPEDT